MAVLAGLSIYLVAACQTRVIVEVGSRTRMLDFGSIVALVVPISELPTLVVNRYCSWIA